MADGVLLGGVELGHRATVVEVVGHERGVVAEAVGAAGPVGQHTGAAAFDDLLSGEVTPVQAGAFLTALAVRGESEAEILGAVSAMRARMLPVAAPPGAIDIVGTGGDHSGSYNVSTLAAILAAACGVKVAKHGNRAATSRSGAADVLMALGVPEDEESETTVRAYLRSLDRAVRPYRVGDYANFVMEPTDARRFFDEDTWTRLRRVKAVYDSDDLFRGNHHIPPAD